MDLNCSACKEPLPYVDGWWLHPDPPAGQERCLGKEIGWGSGHWVVPDLNFPVLDFQLTPEQRDLLLVGGRNRLPVSMITAVKLILLDALATDRALRAEQPTH